jgi:hypothetical protein
LSPGASRARRDGTTSGSRTRTQRPASRAQIGWWSRPSQPRHGAAFTATTGWTAPATTSGSSSSRAKGPSSQRPHVRQHPRGPCVEQVGHAPTGNQKGGIGLGGSLANSPPAAYGVFPAGRGAFPAGRGAYPRGRRRIPSRRTAHHLLHGLRSSFLLSLPCSAAAARRNEQDVL